MKKNIKTDIELKAIAYDMSQQVMFIQGQLRAINEELTKRKNAQSTGKAPEKKKDK